jgi:hypothetical protein
MHSALRLPFVCQPVCGQVVLDGRRIEHRRTALREAAYIRRTRFAKDDGPTHDFAWRGSDLFMLTPIIPPAAGQWAHRPYLRWQMADETAEASGDADSVRAWHICGDLRQDLTRGQWVDQVVAMTRAALPGRIAAEIAIHVPPDKPAHAHILVAPFRAGRRRYGRACPDLHRRLEEDLGHAWLAWLGGG